MKLLQIEQNVIDLLYVFITLILLPTVYIDFIHDNWSDSYHVAKKNEQN